MKDFEPLIQSFHSLYQRNDGRFFFAPGRVNLVGDHVDYLGGHVFPAAIHLGTRLVAAPRTDRMVRLASFNQGSHIVEASLDDLTYCSERGWANYPLGVLHQLSEKAMALPCGVDLFYQGNLPSGAGLSSSASIEVVTALACAKLFDLPLEGVELALLCQAAENHFVGVNCGVMDQFAVTMGRVNEAMLLHCATMNYRYSPLHLGSLQLVIVNTNRPRGLAGSKYNERRSECDEALRRIQKARSLSCLCDACPDELEQMKILIDDEVLFRRVRHGVSENRRALDACEALGVRDLHRFGQLMNQSHESLRDDFEVTGPELDCIVNLLHQCDGFVGARMTGAGFGGCAVALVESEAVRHMERYVAQGYATVTKRVPSFYNVTPSQRACEIEL